MDSQLRVEVRKKAIAREGYKQRAYLDIYGNITAGIGHNLSANDISKDVIEKWFNDDIDYHYQRLSESFDWFNHLELGRKVVLIYMAFNLGWAKFLTFKNMINQLAQYNFVGASHELMDSAYATELPHVAQDIANTLVTGVIS